MAVLEDEKMHELPDGLNNVVKAILLRLSDSNKSIIRSALVTLARLAGTLGTFSKLFARQVIPGLI
jgi:hypothetical protein